MGDPKILLTALRSFWLSLHEKHQFMGIYQFFEAVLEWGNLFRQTGHKIRVLELFPIKIINKIGSKRTEQRPDRRQARHSNKVGGMLANWRTLLGLDELVHLPKYQKCRNLSSIRSKCRSFDEKSLKFEIFWVFGSTFCYF